MINMTELEATRALFPDFKTNGRSWSQAMCRLRGIHQDYSSRGNTVRLAAYIKGYRAALGLATKESGVSNAALYNYGYSLWNHHGGVRSGLLTRPQGS